jgi:Kdo2-lipid IVA lauroyltransferase/acyltransferase
MKYISYILVKIVAYAIGCLPFFVIYGLADVLYFLLRYVLRYRKTVMLDNLKGCFPEKSATEIDEILTAAYRNLADITIEGIKGLTMSAAELRARYSITNPEIVKPYLETSPRGILTGAHYNNWEWGVLSWSLWFQPQVIGIYKPLTNKHLEAWLNKKRSNFGMYLAATYETRKALEVHEGKQSLFVLMGDQSPSNLKTTHWLSFLGRDTAWLHGVGTLAVAHNMPIFYLDTQRIKRGYYQSAVHELCLNPLEHSPEQISQLYANFVAQIIVKNPSPWLWSHKRWKHTRGSN